MGASSAFREKRRAPAGTYVRPMSTVESSATESSAAGLDPLTRIPLSLNQEFLCGFDQGDHAGPFGPKYNIVHACRLTGAVELGAFQDALDDVVVRHEALRTIVLRGGDDRYQQVRPPSPVSLSVRDLSDTAPDTRPRRSEELVLEVEAGEYPSTELPLLHAVLGRFDDTDAVLVLVAHHTAADEWSMQLILRDLVAGYAARTGSGPALAPVRQYREYAAWEKNRADTPSTQRSRDYWRDKLRDATIVALPTDHPRSAGLPKSTAWQRFAISEGLTAAVFETASATRSSPFMVLLAAYNVFLHRRTGSTDITVNTFTSGRGEAGFHDTVGSFFNFVPLRTDLGGCADFREVVSRTRRTCLEAYQHDIPFAEVLAQAPTLMNAAMSQDRALCAFQVFRAPFPAEGDGGGLHHAEIRRRLLPQASGGDIPDGAMWHLDVEFTGEMTGCLGFNTNLFDEDAMTALVAEFQQVLTTTVAANNTPLDQS